MDFHFRGICGAGPLALCLFLFGCRGDDDSTATPDNSGKPNGDVVNSTPDTPTSEEEKPGGTDSPDSKNWKQGWNDEQRHRFYYLSQGSQLVPYTWFINLELPGSDELFKSDRHMAALGCITQPPGDRNPDGLPIGFVKDSNPSSISMKAAFLGPEYNKDHYPNENDWLGLSCAACHTADLSYKGKVIRIDGGAAMADIESFLTTLAASMRATASDDAKFAAFENRIREASGDGAVPPREEFESYTTVIENLVKRNKAPHKYGLARLDAFGAILNQITAAALKIPENRRPSSAPVSYPFLWDTPHMDWVQWNSSAEIPIERNVGEVLGVFAHFKLTDSPDEGYASSARLDYLHDLEVSLRDLKAPVWPAEYFGEIDDAKAAAGKKLFATNCRKCHNSRGEDGNFEMTAPNTAGTSYIKTKSVPFNEIGTDPWMVLNVATRTAKPGILASAVAKRVEELKKKGPDGISPLDRINGLRVQLGMPAADFSQEVPAAILLSATEHGVTKHYLDKSFENLTPEQMHAIELDLRGGHPPGKDNPKPHGGLGYKARPLNGVWATAPFLHNGSVPNLWELLQPEDERIKSFHVGSREFDPKHVGLSMEAVPGSFHFQTLSEDGTPIPGNSNRGHSGDGHTGADGISFTDEERWAIIEYIKTLK